MNKKVGIIIAVVVALLVLGGGGYMIMGKQGAKPTPAVTMNDQEIGTLSPSDIGLKLQLTNDDKKVKVIVGKASDIKNIEYEITYDADVPAAEKVEGGEDRVSRGFSDEAEITSSTYESKEFDLGSCSKNVCRYDTGVTEIKIMMKVTKKDGKLYQVQDSVKI